MTLTTSGYSNIRISLGATGPTTLNFSAGTDDQKLVLELTQGVANATVTWGTGVEFGTSFTSITLSTTINLVDYIGLIYNASASKWRIVAYALGFA